MRRQEDSVPFVFNISSKVILVCNICIKELLSETNNLDTKYRLSSLLYIVYMSLSVISKQQMIFIHTSFILENHTNSRDVEHDVPVVMYN